MKLIVIVVVFLIIANVIVFTICNAPCQVRSEYTTQISVETPDKIGNAISNAVADLEKRDFVPVYLDVMWHPVGKTYVIYARGIDRTKLNKYEP